MGVLFVDVKNKNSSANQDYYYIRHLVLQNFEDRLENLNARLVITNYHTFEPEWHFIEIANEIRYIKNQLKDKIASF